MRRLAYSILICAPWLLAGCTAQQPRSSVENLNGIRRTNAAPVTNSEPAPLQCPASLAAADTPPSSAETEPAPSSPSPSQPPVILNTLDNFHMIVSGRAYRSGQLTPEKLHYVCQTFGIKTVVNLRGANPTESWYGDEKAMCDALGVKLVDISWSARHLPPRDRLLQYFDTIKAESAPLLIHCSAGSDRTGAASAIWRMTIAGDDRPAASKELSIRYGHFSAATPKMDDLVAMFQPRREWIEQEYNP